LPTPEMLLTVMGQPSPELNPSVGSWERGVRGEELGKMGNGRQRTKVINSCSESGASPTQNLSTVSHDVVECTELVLGKLTKTEAPAQYAQWPHHLGRFSMGRSPSRLSHLVSPPVFSSRSLPARLPSESSLVPCFSSTALFFHFQPHSHPRRAPSAFRLPPAIACVLDFGDPRPL